MVNRYYTARGQLKDVGWGAGATSYVYWPDGKVNYQARTNGVTTSYGYDGRGMISSVQHRNNAGGHDLARRDYWRDDRDRILAWKRGSDPTYNLMEDGRGNRYKYDPEGQLERAWYRAQNPETENPVDPKRGDHFYYDALGNRTGWNEVASRGAMLFQGKTNGLNQYFSWENSYPEPPQHWGTTTNYDDDVGQGWGAPGAANGVLMQDGWITAGFNALNQPIQIWSPFYWATTNWMWFGFDPLGRCVKRWVGPSGDPNTTTAATYFYYDGSDLIQEGPSAPLVDRTYVHGARVDEIVASRVSGTWYNHLYDAQGNCIIQSGDNGRIQVQYDYDAFGFPYAYNPDGGKGNAQTRFLFTGREWISDLRLYDYRARLYQPELGRFLQPDPKEFEAGDYNLYRYCHNDPVNKSDPTGLREQLAGEILRDRMWDMACLFDSGNSFIGSLSDFFKSLLPTGGAAGQKETAGGSISWRDTMGNMNITKSGNWGDQKSPDYYTDEDLYANGGRTGGKTNADLKLKAHTDGSVTGNLYVNSQLERKYRGSNVDSREQEHPNGFKDFYSSISTNVFLKMRKEAPTFKTLQQAAEYKRDAIQRSYDREVVRQKAWDQPHGWHDLNTYPPGPP